MEDGKIVGSVTLAVKDLSPGGKQTDFTYTIHFKGPEKDASEGNLTAAFVFKNEEL